MYVRLAAAAGLAAALACSNRQAEVKDEIGRRCAALVPGHSTLKDASNSFADALSSGTAGVLSPSCRNNLEPLGGDDICPYQTGVTTICIVPYEFLTNDCSGPVAGGTCAYRCDVRIAGAPQSTSVICGRQFVTNQPVLAAPAGAPPP